MQETQKSLESRSSLLGCALAALSLAACGGGGGGYGGSTGGGGSTGSGGGYGGGTGGAMPGYNDTALVSDGAVAAKTTDAKLVNPWGIVFAPGDVVWTANNGSQTSTLYDGNGQRNSLVVNIPPGANGQANPTGVVFNSGSQFVIKEGTKQGAAQFIFVGEAGTISGWADGVDQQNAVTAYDDMQGGAVYKGLAIASDAANVVHLYAADFHNNKIDEFDASFNKVPLAAGAFVDPTLPAGYAPFNVQALSVNGTTMLYVAYAKQQGPDNHDNANGAGLGLVDVFDTQGVFKNHLIAASGELNAPWGLALAPANFGPLSGELLVGNFGDGRIIAYDPATGALKGPLSDTTGKALVIPGLWGIAFGNGAQNQPTTTLFYAAGPNQEADGVYGRIDAAN